MEPLDIIVLVTVHWLRQPIMIESMQFIKKDHNPNHPQKAAISSYLQKAKGISVSANQHPVIPEVISEF